MTAGGTARVACIGTGFMAGKHLAALTGLADVEVVAVADSVPERARDVADSLGARAYDDGLRLLATEELDAVWICVPPFAHGDLERAALRRGVPFFVEKPLANDLETARGIAAEVEAADLLAAVGYHWRYLGLVDELVELCRDVPPVLVNGYWLDATPPVAWWSRREHSGGQVLEQTTHILDLARHVAGEVDSVHGVEAGDPDPGGVPFAAAAVLRFRSGSAGTVSSARMLPGRHRVALHVVGDGYAAELTERSLVDHELRVTTRSGERSTRSAEDPVAREDRAFVDAVLGRGDDVRSPYAGALRSHALAWSLDLSAREGRPVSPWPADADA